MGRGGSPVVSVLAFYSNDPNSNPAGYLNFLYKKTKINEKEFGVGTSFKNIVDTNAFWWFYSQTMLILAWPGFCLQVYADT